MADLRAVAALTDLAEGQWGQVTAAQASAAGVSGADLTELVQLGIAETVLGGVVRLRGGARHPVPRLYAAWLQLVPDAPAWERQLPASGVVSHQAAVRLYRLSAVAGPQVHFTIPSTSQAAVSTDVELHPGALADGQWRMVDDLPVTTPARTLADLTAGRAADVTEVQALVRGFVTAGWATIDELAAALDPDDPRSSELLSALLATPQA